MSWGGRQQSYGGSHGGGYGGGSQGGGYGGHVGRQAPAPSSRPAPAAVAPSASYGGPSSRAPPAGAMGGAPPLSVSGCANPTVANIIKGMYTPQGQNHGKPVYKKEGAPGSVSVLIYFWDDRDGPSFGGWWFGPKVGGDQVWAYNGNKQSSMPPLHGWKVPWDGPIDDSLRIAMSHGPPAGGGGGSVVPPRRDNRYDAPDPNRARMEEEERRRREADRQRALAEQQRREEERRRRAAEDARRQKEREEEQERKAAELRKKREEEEQRRKEQAAALVVRKVIQRVRIATPDNYDSLRNELEEAQAAQLENMGSQAEKVSQEAEKALQQAQQRIDEINEKRAADEKRRLEEEKRKQEEKELVERLMKEANEEVAAAEEQVTEATDAAKGITEEAEPDAIVESATAAEQAIADAKKSIESTNKSITDKRKEMGYSDAAHAVKGDINQLYDKLEIGSRSLSKLEGNVKHIREKAQRKAAALKKVGRQKAEFEKLDAASKGYLSRNEVTDFASAEYHFEVPEAILNKVFKSLEPISFEKFHRVRAMIGIAKSEAEARTKRAEAEEKRKAVEAQKAEIQKVIDEASAKVEAAEKSANEAEKQARPLLRGDGMSAEEMKAEAAKADEAVKATEVMLEEAQALFNKIVEQCSANDDVKDYDKREVPNLESRHRSVAGRLTKISSAAKSGREEAVRKAYAEVEKKRNEAVTALRNVMTVEGKSGEQLFEMVGAGESLTQEKFIGYLKGLADFTVEDEMAGKLFEQIAGEESKISKDQFLDLIRLYYKCVKATVLTESISIKSKTVRRLDVQEVLEVVEGPTKEEGVNVQRVKCKAVSDTAVGWATIAGNQGTAFLEPGGNLYTCIKETVITDGLSVEGSGTVRRLSKGEVVEVIEFAKKDAGIKRVKAKAKQDGATGWITVLGNQGTAFLELC